MADGSVGAADVALAEMVMLCETPVPMVPLGAYEPQLEGNGYGP